MKRLAAIQLVILSIFCGIGASQTREDFSLIEEDQVFWRDFLGQKDINNRNLLYASYMAYKERLTDLSIESFRECIKRNTENEPVKAVSCYYIGKNYYLLGQYREAIRYFTEAVGMNLHQFKYIVHAIMLNMAITHLKVNEPARFRQIVDKVIVEDDSGRYGNIGRAMLNQVR